MIRGYATIRRRPRSVRNSERGASIPETAIVMAVLLALMFGIIDSGRMLYTYNYVAQLAREGARWAIVRGANCTAYSSACPANSGTGDIQPYIRSLNEGAMKTSNIQASLKFTTPCSNGATKNQPGCVAEVTVSYPFTFIFPLPNTTIDMSSTSQMVIAN